MKILLINDTRIESNPGCHATVNELLKYINNFIKDSYIETLHVGSEYDIFKGKSVLKKTSYYKITNKLKKVISKSNFHLNTHHSINNVNIRLWKKISQNNFSIHVKELIKSKDLIIINMEGTIHDNNIGALTLLAFAYYSKKVGKKVIMTNGSYFKIDKKLSKIVLKNIDFISVREIISYNQLKQTIKNIYLIPDFAFKADINNSLDKSVNIPKKDNGNKLCLYTCGVLGAYPNQEGGISINQIIEQIKEIEKSGYVPYFLKIEEKEEPISQELKNIGINTIPIDSNLNYTNIGSLMLNFDIVITGRYHIGIFGLMNNIPTYFLPSNTQKIEGLLQMFELDELLIKNNISLHLRYSKPALNKKTSIVDLMNMYFPLEKFLKELI